MTGLKLMECNLNARNLAGHGFATLSAFARSVPALVLTYGSFDQLGGVSRQVRAIHPGREHRCARPAKAHVGHSGRLRPRPGSRQPAPATAVQKFPIPSPTPRKSARKLTIGMATYRRLRRRVFHPPGAASLPPGNPRRHRVPGDRQSSGRSLRAAPQEPGECDPGLSLRSQGRDIRHRGAGTGFSRRPAASSCCAWIVTSSSFQARSSA